MRLKIARTREFGRRRFIAGTMAAASVGFVPAYVTGCSRRQPEGGRTITAVMNSDLRVTDPILTIANITRDHAYMVYDTLLAIDGSFGVRPQMAEWRVSDDKLTYTFTLRSGLNWHDGTPVTAEDCVASLRRWGAVDGMGQKLMQFTASLQATDRTAITLKLKESYGLVLESIAKPGAYVPFMMPKRLAETAPDTAISEQIGSGPFKFVEAEFRPGVKAVYERNADYVPRSEPPNGMAGAKVVKVDRVEWITMPDPQTAINALRAGEIDYLEYPPFDLLPILEGDTELEVRPLNPLGFQNYGRMNFLHPPFDRLEMRRAAMLALNQKDFLDALVGNPRYYQLCGSVFGCGTPLESDLGSASVVKGDGMAAAKRLLADSGYAGMPVVILAPTDALTVKTQPVVAAQLLREAGFKVDLQSMDPQTFITRRYSQKPPHDGGWNMFFSVIGATDIMNPLGNLLLNARGKRGGYSGWPEDVKMEALRDSYARAGSLEEQKKIAAEIQARTYEQVIYVPLGQYLYPNVWRKQLRGVLDTIGPRVFWNVEKSP